MDSSADSPRPASLPSASASLSRRGALGRLAGLLALGSWPGAVGRAATAVSGGVGAVRFVVINDFHHEDADCDPWMKALFRQVATTKGAAFCFGLGDLADSGKRESLESMARLSALSGMPFSQAIFTGKLQTPGAIWSL